jgi:hypothetical protein
MKEPDDLEMYAEYDDDSKESVKPISSVRRTDKIVEIIIFDKKLSMVNLEYVETLHQTINVFERKVRELELMIKRLNNEVKDMKTGNDRYGNR